jgi:hypothetical protein
MFKSFLQSGRKHNLRRLLSLPFRYHNRNKTTNNFLPLPRQSSPTFLAISGPRRAISIVNDFACIPSRSKESKSKQFFPTAPPHEQGCARPES